jgi:RND family efflux transporter MFP subunit
MSVGAEPRPAGTGRRLPGRLAAAVGRLSYGQKAVTILAAGLLGFVLLILLRPRPPQQEPPRRLPLVAAVPVEVRSGHLSVFGNGTVRPRSEVAISPQVGGRVEWVSPDLVSGGRFQAGDVLFRIEPADYQNAVEIASAEVAERRVAVLQAKEERELAVEEYDRLRAREGIDIPRDSSELGSLVFREPQLEAARAALRRAQARLEDAKLALSRTRVRAPFDGVVRSEALDIGQYVAPGQTAASIYSIDEVEIVVPLTDDAVSLIAGLWTGRAAPDRKPIPATVSATFGNREFEWAGYVDRAEGALDEETRTVDVVVRVPDPFSPDSGTGRPPLLLGTYVDVSIEGVELDHYVVVPRGAFRDGDVIWLAEADSVLRVTPAELIQEAGESVFLEADVTPGDRVIISPLDVVTDGMGIRVAEDSGP